MHHHTQNTRFSIYFLIYLRRSNVHRWERNEIETFVMDNAPGRRKHVFFLFLIKAWPKVLIIHFKYIHRNNGDHIECIHTRQPYLDWNNSHESWVPSLNSSSGRKHHLQQSFQSFALFSSIKNAFKYENRVISLFEALLWCNSVNQIKKIGFDCKNFFVQWPVDG